MWEIGEGVWEIEAAARFKRTWANRFWFALYDD